MIELVIIILAAAAGDRLAAGDLKSMAFLLWFIGLFLTYILIRIDEQAKSV